MARILVRPLVGTVVTPNHLTVLRLGVGLASLGLLAHGRARALLWSGVLWVVACLLDRADGELARLADLRSERGRILDFYSDLVLDAGWFLAAGFSLEQGIYRGAGPYLGLLTCVSMVMSIWFAELFDRASPAGVKAWAGTQRFHPDDALFLLAPVTWIGWVAPTLLLASLCTPVIVLVMYGRHASQRRRTRAV